MSAPASEDGHTANLSLFDAYPHDVIIHYIYKPTIVDHPIVYVLFQVLLFCCLVLIADCLNRTVLILLLFTVIHPSICDSSPQAAHCGVVPRIIADVVGGCWVCLLVYLSCKFVLLHWASHREDQEELVCWTSHREDIEELV